MTSSSAYSERDACAVLLSLPLLAFGWLASALPAGFSVNGPPYLVPLAEQVFGDQQNPRFVY